MSIGRTNIGRRDLRAVWKREWESKGFRLHLTATVPVLLVTLFFFKRFLDWVELRPGVVLPDPVLAHIAPVNLTWVTFAAIYIGLLLAVFSLSFHPRELLLALQSYLVMVLFRIVLMYLVPLDAPTGLIPLKDPFVEMFGSGVVLTKDLFFSGHTATLFLLYLTAKHPVLRMAFLVLTGLVGVSVIWQHVHYVADVAIGPFISYSALRLVSGIQKK